jgi:hypothetical protein
MLKLKHSKQNKMKRKTFSYSCKSWSRCYRCAATAVEEEEVAEVESTNPAEENNEETQA